MEALLDAQHGAATLLVGLIVILALHLVMKVGELIWDIIKDKNKDSKTEITEISMALRQNTDAVRELRVQISVLQQELVELQKLKIDTSKLFSAVKIMSGKRWPNLRKAVEADLLPK